MAEHQFVAEGARGGARALVEEEGVNDQAVAEVVNLHTDQWAQVVLLVMVANEEHQCRLEEE